LLVRFRAIPVLSRRCFAFYPIRRGCLHMVARFSRMKLRRRPPIRRGKINSARVNANRLLSGPSLAIRLIEPLGGSPHACRRFRTSGYAAGITAGVRAWRPYCSESGCRPSRLKLSGNRQCAPLVGFQGNLLRQHHVACDETISRHETPAGFWVTGVVKLLDIRSAAVAYPVPLTAMAASDLEIFVQIILGELLWR
jgi:hypothetical protein